MLPEDDHMIEICRRVLSVFNVNLYMCICLCVTEINYKMHGATIKIFRNDTSGTPNAHSTEDVFSCSRRLSLKPSTTVKCSSLVMF
jgi:formate-dependent phosphoribosylglycinamide formyltransferase (GAR transformylase)